ncbi:hypothetical protein [Ekhidna sp.]
MKTLKSVYFLLALAALISACGDDDGDGAIIDPDGGMISGGPFNFIVDGTADNIPDGAITVDNSGTDLGSTGWVVTDEDGNILGLPPSFTAPDFDAAGSGVCLVWYVSYAEGLTGLEVGNSVDDIEGTFALSNPVTVNRLDAPTLSGGPFTFTVGDGEADNLAEGDITVDGGFALENQSGWVVTDDQGNILGLPPSFTAPDFDGAGGGTCYIYYITYAEGLTGLTGPDMDGNPTSSLDDLDGVYELSNNVEVIRQTAAILEGGPFNFVVDGTADNIPEGGITVTAGTDLGNTGWVVTDEDGNILGLPPAFTGPDFDAAGPGTCLVYYISYEDGLDGLTGPDMDGNATSSLDDLSGTYLLSNYIEVNRLDAPTLTGGPFNFTVSDGIADNIGAGEITVEGGYAPNDQSSWVVTDDQGAILGLPGSFTDPDFDGAGAGTCYIYYIAYAEGLEGLTGPDSDGNATSSLDDLMGTYELSNSIEVNREVIAE